MRAPGGVPCVLGCIEDGAIPGGAMRTPGGVSRRGVCIPDGAEVKPMPAGAMRAPGGVSWCGVVATCIPCCGADETPGGASWRGAGLSWLGDAATGFHSTFGALSFGLPSFRCLESKVRDKERVAARTISCHFDCVASLQKCPLLSSIKFSNNGSHDVSPPGNRARNIINCMPNQFAPSPSKLFDQTGISSSMSATDAGQ
mmetsp:Transcript_77794/g.225773  ORF Transcript_77794/g.225773 Transcript_77794/m.225773 type:complete len:200 (-) Transcript_77794:1116-1715(-)